MVGNAKDNPAWMYLELDCNRMSDEQHRLLKRLGDTRRIGF